MKALNGTFQLQIVLRHFLNKNEREKESFIKKLRNITFIFIRAKMIRLDNRCNNLSKIYLLKKCFLKFEKKF